MGPTILFQQTFTFIYNIFNKKFSILVKLVDPRQILKLANEITFFFFPPITTRNNLLLMICNENIADISFFFCEIVKTASCRHNIFTTAKVSF